MARDPEQKRLWAEQRMMIEKVDLTLAGMGGSHKLVLLMLHAYADTAGQAWPGQRVLAKRCCLGRSTMQNVLQALASKGVLSTEKRYRGDGGQSSNLVRINFDVLDQLLEEEAKTQAQRRAGGGPESGQGVGPDSGGGAGPITGQAPAQSPGTGGPESGRAPAQNQGASESSILSRSKSKGANAASGVAPGDGEGQTLKEFTDLFCELWSKHRQGAPYYFTARDAVGVAKVRKAVKGSLSVWRGMVERFMRDGTPFVVNKGHQACVLCDSFQRYAAAAPHDRGATAGDRAVSTFDPKDPDKPEVY